jgi:LAGLIDADG endonuclease
VKTLERLKPTGGSRVEIRLYLQIDQKTRFLLDLIKGKIGGNIGYRKSQDTYFYSSTSFGSARQAIKYLDKYHLLSSKYINYIKWRKVYLLVQQKKHLTVEGQAKINKIKKTMNNYSKETLDLSM